MFYSLLMIYENNCSFINLTSFCYRVSNSRIKYSDWNVINVLQREFIHKHHHNVIKTP